MTENQNASSQPAKTPVTKFKLSSGKEVYLKEPQIGDSEYAMKIAGKEAGPENEGYLSVLFQKEMAKVLLVKIDDKTLSLQDKADLKSLFNFREWSQVLKAVQLIVGDEGNFELTPEHTSL